MVNRRSFLKSSTAAGASAWLLPRAIHAESTPSVAPRALEPLRLGEIRPAGWLRRQLEIQASGLSGHLDETWADVGPESGWLGGKGESWERGPYYLDGLVPLAYLLDDARLKAKVQPWMEWTIRSQRPDGNFGPLTKNNDWWPRMVMLKALTQYEEATGDPRVLPMMVRYFEYQRATLPSQPLVNWAKYRWQDNLLSVLWLYDRKPDPRLLETANLLRSQGYDWRAQFENFRFTEKTSRAALEAAKKAGTGGYHETHGVDVAMGLKSAALWSRLSRDPADAASTATMIAILDRFHGLPNGMYSADEHLAGRRPVQGTELCTVVELMYSLEQSVAITGDATVAQRLEKIAFNALPGALSDDMWSHQYDQQPNQIECSLKVKPWTNNGPEANLFGLAPNFGCCAANFHQGWPKLAASLWMRTPEDGLAAVVYAPSIVSTKVRGTLVQIVTVTSYPFRGTVDISVRPESEVEFPLRLRLPHSEGRPAIVSVNGQAIKYEDQRGFAILTRRWKRGDAVRVEFSMEPRMLAGYANTVSVMRGPLVFSLPLEEKWEKLRDRGMTADWQVFSHSQWSFGLAPNARFCVTEKAIGDVPFGKSTPAVVLETAAATVENLQADGAIEGDLPAAPIAASGELKSVALVPYASTKLRITAFPIVRSTNS